MRVAPPPAMRRASSLGMPAFAAAVIQSSAYTLAAINTGGTRRTLPFWFPIAGDDIEELHGGALNPHLDYY